MNHLSEIITATLEQADWNVSLTNDADFKSLMGRLVNRAYQILTNDAPFFLEDNVRIYTEADVASLSDTIAVVATDAYVMFRTTPTAGADAAAWVFDGTWDGRSLEITDPDGKIVEVKSREWWQAGGNDYVSMERPWSNTTDTAMAYRVFTPHYNLPGDVIEIHNAQFHGESNYQLGVKTQGEMERGQLVDYRGRATGQPEIIYRGPAEALVTPTFPPIAAIEDPNWQGPDNAGSFEYCWTRCIGRRMEHSRTNLNLIKPRWESAPSPVSNKVVQTSNAGNGISVTLPNIDKEIAFGIAGTTRLGRAGQFKRIYCRRSASIADATIGDIIQSPNVWMLLDEVLAETETYRHDGSKFLDPDNRLKPVHNYQTLRLYPRADAEYQIDVRVQYKAMKLEADQDTPRIPEDAIDALLQKSLELLYEHEGKLEAAGLASSRYNRQLSVLTKRYGLIEYQVPQRKAARVTRGPGGAIRSRNVTYTEPT